MTSESKDAKEEKATASGAGGRQSRAAILDGPIRSTLFHLTWPMMLTALLNSWQVLIAVFWIGRLIGTSGLTTIAVMEPVFTILMLISGAAHVGVQVMTAKATGKGEGDAIPVIINGGYLALTWAVTVSIVGLVLLGPITKGLAGDIAIVDDLQRFLIPWLVFYAASNISGVTMFAVSATGWTRFGVIQTIVSIGLVLTLMPLFIAGFDLDLAGVSLSDGISDTLLLALTGFALYRFRDDLGLGAWRRPHWRVDFGIWRQIAGVGLFYQAARAMDFVSQAVMVRIIMESGRKADVAAYGVTFLLISHAAGALSCFGVAGSIMIGQNVGAKQPERAKAILRSTLIVLGCFGAGLVLLASYPAPLIRIFTDDPDVVARATDTVAALRWTVPPALMSVALLRSYTAVSANKLGNTLSIVCALLAIAIASVWPGEPLPRVTAGLLISQYLRLVVLILFYRRSFGRALRVHS